MDFKNKLAGRIGMEDINEMLRLTRQNDKQKQELYNLVFDEDDSIAYQATWVLTHFSPQENRWLYDMQNELIDEVLVCKHGGKRRVILNLLFKQPLENPPRVDFLDFCFERMVSKEELPGVQTLCMKIAYELCLPFPELIQELKTTLEIMGDNLCPAMSTTRRKVLKAMRKDRSLQKL